MMPEWMFIPTIFLTAGVTGSAAATLVSGGYWWLVGAAGLDLDEPLGPMLARGSFVGAVAGLASAGGLLILSEALHAGGLV